VAEQSVGDLHPRNERLVRPAWEFRRTLQRHLESACRARDCARRAERSRLSNQFRGNSMIPKRGSATRGIAITIQAVGGLSARIRSTLQGVLTLIRTRPTLCIGPIHAASLAAR
jgi:hypothetical protein